MPRAKEWAERFAAAEDVGTELAAFMAEIGDISKARGNTPNAVEGAVREQKAKFAAICRLTTRVNFELWQQLMKAHGAEYRAEIAKYLKLAGAKKPARRNKRAVR